jgi:hypothetical protein
MTKDTKETTTTDPIFDHYMKELEERLDLFDTYVEWWMSCDWDAEELTIGQVSGRLRTAKKIRKQTLFINAILEDLETHAIVKGR